jgi:exodeoxyribonuclease VII small subunit
MTKNSAASTDTEAIGYQDALAELDEILDELEGDAVDVDRLGARVKRAAELIAICRGRIASAKVEIESVVADLDRLDDIGTA